MAEYIRFRLTTAKLGVTMAFMALLGGLAEKASASRANGSPKASFFNDVSNPLASGLDHAVIKLTNSFVKLDNEFQKLSQTLHKDYPTFLKVDSTFLKIKVADAQFLKLDGVATNSIKLGGLPASAFVQGQASVVTGMASLTKGNSSAPLVQSADGLITVKVAVNADGSVTLVVHNNTSVNLTAVTGDPTAVELPAGQDSAAISIGRISANTAVADHLQILPAGSFNKVMTLTVSADQPATGGATEVVAQMVDGSV